MSWFKKASINIKEAQESYLDIGHDSSLDTVILWAHDGKQLKTKELEPGESDYETHTNTGTSFGTDNVATGRVDVQNGIGSIAPSNFGNSWLSRKEDLKRAINDLLAEFPNIKFTVYTGRNNPTQSLTDFYQTL